MRTAYDVTQPRIVVTNISTGDQRELGQAEAMGEAMFFLRLGCFVVHIFQWNGKLFENAGNFLPGDS